MFNRYEFITDFMDFFLPFVFSLSIIEQFYFICLIIGSILFIPSIGSFIFNRFTNRKYESVDEHTLGLKARLTSTQSLASFFFVSGSLGLTLIRGEFTDILSAIILATVSGFSALIMSSSLLTFIEGSKPGGNIKLKDAIGKEGHAHSLLSPTGLGEVKVIIRGFPKIFYAYSNKKEEIKRGEAVKIVGIREISLLIEKL